MIDRALIRKARRASLENYLKNKGLSLKKEGRQYRVENGSGLMVSGSMWYSHTLQKGGNSLDYLMVMEGRSFKEAVQVLSGVSIHVPVPTSVEDNGTISIPKRNADDKRVMAYLLKTRGISAPVLLPLLDQGIVYQAAATHNAVFIGRDGADAIQYAMQRSTLPSSSLKFESKGSDKRFSFSLKGKSDILFCFESPIDLLSCITIHRMVLFNRHHLLSLGGVSDIALSAYIDRFPGIRTIVFCLDSDQAGQSAYAALSRKYTGMGFKILCRFPEKKDWNAQLLDVQSRA
jgi:hypothetical protein